MSVVSLGYLIFVVISIVLYYLFPKKLAWVVLMLSSLFYIFAASEKKFSLLAIFLCMALLTYISSNIIVKIKSEKSKTLVVSLTIIALVSTLIYFKELIFFANILKFEMPKLLAPIGISYFTLILIGYILDVHWGNITSPMKNPFKLITFAGYFPQITSGPFTNYNNVKDSIFNRPKLELKNFQFGIQRIFWGFFKKIVIADRIAILVQSIYSSPESAGLIQLVGIFAYTVQVYMDFSGCMDIILGISEIYGIKLAENFARPWASTSLSEVWRRWHITLGLYLRNYVLYPTLKSNWLNKIRTFCKDKFGKKVAKDIPTYVGMFIVWFLVGFWHGGSYKYIFSSGLFFFIMIVGGLILEPFFEKVIKFFKINVECFSYKLFQQIRSFVLFSFAVSFGRRETLMQGFSAVKSVFTTWNPWVLFDGSFLRLGLDNQNFNIVIAGLLIVFIVSTIQEKFGSAREFVAKQNLVFRWFIYLSLIFAVLIFGLYGPNYDPAKFIYGAF